MDNQERARTTVRLAREIGADIRYHDASGIARSMNQQLAEPGASIEGVTKDAESGILRLLDQKFFTLA